MRVIRQVAAVQQNIHAVIRQNEELKQTDIYHFKLRVDDSLADGVDLLAEMAAAVDLDIARIRRRLSTVRGEAGEPTGADGVHFETRIVRFPSEQNCGTLFIRKATSVDFRDWQRIGIARGAKEVFLDTSLRLDVKVVNGMDTGFLKELRSDDLQSLFLYNCDDSIISHIEHLTGLQELYFSDTGLSDQGLALLRPLKSLQRISIYHTAISDKGILNLALIPRLKWLTCSGINATEEGFNLFRRVMPGCKTVKLQMALLVRVRGKNMLQVGNYNKLEITRITASGAVFSTESGEVLLPLRLLPSGAEAGTLLDVFVYVDSEERLTATTKRPRAVVGEFALLKVIESTTVGSFLDWGLEKDLLLPFGEQLEPVRRGDQVLVRIYLHSSGRIAASAKLDKFIVPVDDSITEGDEVTLLVYAATDLGTKVIINDRFGGLIFHTELVVKPKPGERLRGYVKKIREDGKVDVTLRQGGAQEAEKDRRIILEALAANNGFLTLTDKSTPEEIATLLRLSKKSFKKALGGLYKEGAVTMLPGGIRLRAVQTKGAE